MSGRIIHVFHFLSFAFLFSTVSRTVSLRKAGILETFFKIYYINSIIIYCKEIICVENFPTEWKRVRPGVETRTSNLNCQRCTIVMHYCQRSIKKVEFWQFRSEILGLTPGLTLYDAVGEISHFVGPSPDWSISCSRLFFSKRWNASSPRYDRYKFSRIVNCLVFTLFKSGFCYVEAIRTVSQHPTQCNL